jgi:two-component system, sensor histidine kinase and response regulator
MNKILIIEDHHLLCDEIRDWFTFEGFQTHSAYNGCHGIELALQHLPDVILCDIMMPEMSGMQVLERLRNEPATKLIPFIFMTALADREDLRSGMEGGADDYVTKPFTRDELLNAVRTRLQKTVELKENAEAAIRELRENLIYGLPHELRTPLNAMVAYGEVLKDDADSYSYVDIKEMGEQIYTSAMRLFRLIENYLLYAQLELKKVDKGDTYILADPAAVCQKTAMAVAAKHGREIDLQILASEGRASITELEFAKIVEELVDNAFKFSKPGQAVVVSCGDAEGTFRLLVADNGRGIAAANVQKIGAYMQFDRKLQAQEGSGLGLVIAKRIVELFYGTISLESAPEKGTIVTVALPAKA